MSSRNRPRGHHSQDADEDQKRIWAQIKADARKVDEMLSRQQVIGHEVAELERSQQALLDDEKLPEPAADDRLESLLRENVRISENIAHMIQGESDGMSLLENIDVLRGLREVSEDHLLSQPVPERRAASKQRNSFGVASGANGNNNNNKRKLQPDDGDETPTAMPSPRLGNARTARDRPRGGSTHSAREASVKLEDSAESVTSSAADMENTPITSTAPGHGGFGANPRRLTLNLGETVFYRKKGRDAEGEGILCRVTNVIGEGKQRRYEIQDTDPEPMSAADGGGYPAPYRASVSHLVPIPETNIGLPDLPRGRQVLAQYPDTTTFYKAEVSQPWKANNVERTRGQYVQLRFEGEMEETKESEVERRYVVIDR